MKYKVEIQVITTVNEFLRFHTNSSNQHYANYHEIRSHMRRFIVRIYGLLKESCSRFLTLKIPFFPKVSKKRVMEILQTIYIGVVVATFLFNTGRIIKAVDIFNECLMLLNGIALETIKELTPTVIYVYDKLLDGYTLMYDHTRAIECGKKLHVILHNSGQKEKEGTVLLKLANIYYQRGKYEETKQFYEEALSIMIETGNNYGLQICYQKLGTVFVFVGHYTKAEEYLQKALGISKEIGDKHGQAADHRNLGIVFKCVGQYTKAEEYLQRAH